MPVYFTSSRILTGVALALSVVGMLGCSHTRRTNAVPEENPKSSEKVTVDAYLFDAVLVRAGKTTSFRLELYATDTIVGLAGRGYLGKGALRGVMGNQRLRVYFPSTNEFVDDSFESLLSDSTCPISLRNFDPVQFLSQLPDSATLDSQIRVENTKNSGSRREYEVQSTCGWKLSLSYDHRESGWRPIEMRFLTSGGTSLKASRREFRPASHVSANKFGDPVPPGAVPMVH